MTGNEVVLRGQMPVASFTDAVKAGELLAQSGMFGINNVGAGFVVVTTCMAQGISLMEFQRTYHIVDGKPSMKADAMLAEFRKRGGTYKIIENSTERAASEFTFEGVVRVFEYTMDDARRTGDCFKKGKELKHNWEHRPEDMLWARMVSRAVRRLCPEIVAGIYTPEEVEDFTDGKATGSGAAPVPLTDAARAERANVVVPDVVKPATATQPTATEPDYTRCPDGFGDYSGKLWTEMDNEILNAAIGSALDDSYKEQIWAVLEEREHEAAKGGAQ